MSRHLILSAFCAAALALPAPAADKKKAEPTGQDLVFLTDARPVRVRVHITVDGKPLEQAWRDFIKDVFNSLDADKDGTLDKKEAARIPSPQSVFNSSPYFLFDPRQAGDLKVDTDRDGKVTEQELADFYAANGGAAFGIGSGGNNGGLILRQPGGGGVQKSTSRLNNRIFELLDADKDGKLSAKELAAAPQVLRKLDADEDEILTAEELLGEGGGTQDDYEVFTFDGGMGATPDYPFYLVPASGALDAVVGKVMKRYGGDKALTQKKVGLDEATFKAFDKDGDGKLDAKELDLFLRGGADIEVKVALGEKNAVELATSAEALKALGAEASVEKGTLTFKVGTNQFTLGFGGGGGDGIRFTGIDSKQIWKMQFTDADKDNNGYLDENEAMASPLFAGAFKRFDADGDGKLYLKEVLASVDETAALSEKGTKVCTALDVADRGKGLYEMLDVNGDGRLSERELRQVAKSLGVLDADKDGQVNRAEVPRSFTLNMRRGAVGGGAIGAFAVATLDRGGSAPPPSKGKEPVWFHKMDRNGDGDVSRKEFIGTNEQFKALDRDGDGLISEEEARTFDKDRGK